MKKNKQILLLLVFSILFWFMYFVTKKKLSFDDVTLGANGTDILTSLDKSGAYNSHWLTSGEMKTLCGVKCLFLISEYYDLNIPYEDLKFLLEPDSRGTSMKRLKDVAINLGFQVKAQKIDTWDLDKLDCPFIIFVQRGDKESLGGHYIVGLPLPSSGGVAFYDPPRKTHVVTPSELEESPQKTHIILSLSHD